MSGTDYRAQLSSLWTKHKESFRFGSLGAGCAPKAETGFCVVDCVKDPAVGYFIVKLQDSSLVSVRATLENVDEARQVSLDDLCRKAFNEAFKPKPPSEMRTASSLPVHEAISFFGLDGAIPILAEKSAFLFVEGLPVALSTKVKATDLVGLAAKGFEKAGLGDIKSGVAPKALDIVRKNEHLNWPDYNFYASPEKGFERIQAASVYPVLASFFARRKFLSDVIDERQSLNGALAETFGLSKGTIKRLQNTTWNMGPLSSEMFLSVLNEMPPDWFPKDQAERDAFCVAAYSIGVVLKHATAKPTTELFDGCKGKWQEFVNRVAKAAQLPDSGVIALTNASLDVTNMVREFTDKVVLPAAGLIMLDEAKKRGEDEETVFLSQQHVVQANIAASQILFHKKSAANILDTSRYYHTQRGNVVSTLVKDREGWVPITANFQASNGLWVIPLTTPQELADEGRHGPDSNGIPGLFHCVGGYTDACKNRGHHIVSVRIYDDPKAENSPFTRMCTAELNPISWNDNTIRCAQIRGYDNGTPSNEAQAAFNEWRREVSSGRLKINREEINLYLVSQGKKVRGDDILARCLYNWREVDEVEQAVRSYSDYLSSDVHRGGMRSLEDYPEFSNLVESLTPYGSLKM